MRNIDILTLIEKQAFDSPPTFSSEEQNKYFVLPPIIEEYWKSIVGPINKIGFILLFGYCQANNRFHKPAQFRKADLQYVCNQQRIPMEQVNLSRYSLRTCNNHKQIIREYMDLKPFDEEAKRVFLDCINDRVIRHYSPKQILQEVQLFLQTKKIEIPSYNRFALSITQAISNHDKRLALSIEICLSDTQKTSLDNLLVVDDNNHSKLSRLKNIGHSKKPKKIKASNADFQLIVDIYQCIVPLLSTLNLHSDLISIMPPGYVKQVYFKLASFK